MAAVARAGTSAFVPYAARKLISASVTPSGGTGEEKPAMSERNGAWGSILTLESWGLGPNALLAALGIFLLWGPASAWEQAPLLDAVLCAADACRAAPARSGTARHGDPRLVRRGHRIPGFDHGQRPDDAARRPPRLGGRAGGPLYRKGRLRGLRVAPTLAAHSYWLRTCSVAKATVNTASGCVT